MKIKGRGEKNSDLQKILRSSSNIASIEIIKNTRKALHQARDAEKKGDYEFAGQLYASAAAIRENAGIDSTLVWRKMLRNSYVELRKHNAAMKKAYKRLGRLSRTVHGHEMDIDGTMRDQFYEIASTLSEFDNEISSSIAYSIGVAGDMLYKTAHKKLERAIKSYDEISYYMDGNDKRYMPDFDKTIARRAEVAGRLRSKDLAARRRILALALPGITGVAAGIVSEVSMLPVLVHSKLHGVETYATAVHNSFLLGTLIPDELAGSAAAIVAIPAVALVYRNRGQIRIAPLKVRETLSGMNARIQSKVLSIDSSEALFALQRHKWNAI
jgi:hypothetical protein